MSSNKKQQNARKGSNKTFASKRTMNPPQGNASHQGNTGSTKSFQEHDTSHRQGSFAGRCNHPRTGNPGHE